MSTRTHTLTVSNAAIIEQLESRTFKFGKARDTGGNDKLINNVKLTDLGYERNLVYHWIDEAIGNIRVAFAKYARGARTSYASGHSNDNDYKITEVDFVMSSHWPTITVDNVTTEVYGDSFDNDCNEYIINAVISDFLGLSLPKEADLYGQKANQALKNAERKLYYKTA